MPARNCRYVPSAPPPAAKRPVDVDVVIQVRILDRDAHACHGSQMDHRCNVMFPKEPGHQLAVANVPRHKGKARRVRGARQLPQVGLLARRVVVIVQVVEADHRVTTCQQRLSGMTADEPGGPGNQNRLGHCGLARTRCAYFCKCLLFPGARRAPRLPFEGYHRNGRVPDSEGAAALSRGLRSDYPNNVFDYMTAIQPPTWPLPQAN